MKSSKPILIWDLPTRLFHWLLASGFVAAAAIALVAGDDSPLFPYHALIGLAITLMVVMRVAWGFTGSRYARFASFVFGPRAVAAYMNAAFRGGGARHIGHNPGSAWAIFAMLALVLALGATGMALGRGVESVKEPHEFLAYFMVGAAVLHILGVAMHTVRHGENITAGMIHGRKEADAAAGIATPHYIVAVVFVVLSGLWAWRLVANYDAATRATSLPIVGTSIQIGEAEDDEHSERRAPHDDDD